MKYGIKKCSLFYWHWYIVNVDALMIPSFKWPCFWNCFGVSFFEIVFKSSLLTTRKLALLLSEYLSFTPQKEKNVYLRFHPSVYYFYFYSFLQINTIPNIIWFIFKKGSIIEVGDIPHEVIQKYLAVDFEENGSLNESR